MTELENTDKTDSLENVTVTSDAAFERVTSDIKMEEGEDGGYLKQNTAGLVQEIPNISFLDVSDTLLESNKTLYKKENWVLRVGVNAKSIETQPQDTITLKLTDDYEISSFPGSVKFDDGISSLNYTVCKIDEDNPYRIKVLQTGYYRISYGWTIDPGNSTTFSIGVFSNGGITADKFEGGNYGDVMSGGRTIGNVYLEEGDYIYMDVISDDTITFFKNYTYLDIQFQQYTL